ncbi:diguanylate cyclase [Lacibacterium aquatile]|uniref:diguanylate cyclase n=1 Tax=Lacibacterium aquatile TaxID=1168082 RepID=A0ABW5DNT3_9PROT
MAGIRSRPNADYPTPTRLLSVGYILGLSLIALMSLMAHMTLGRVIAENRDTAEIVNLAGRQRMLSQRIAFYADRYTQTGAQEDRARMLAGAEEMATAHKRLMGETSGAQKLTLSPTLKDIYFIGPAAVDPQVRGFLSHVSGLGMVRETDAGRFHSLAIVEAAENDLLAGLERVVLQYEKENAQAIERLETMQRYTVLFILATLIAEAFLIFRPLVNRVRVYSNELKQQALTDALTGVANRRAYIETSKREIARFNRTGLPLCVVVGDIDHFKQVNDRHGHDIGDATLKMVAQALAKVLRQEDVLARTGGEEFSILLPGTALHAACEVADRLRDTVSKQTVTLPNGDVLQVTMSFGIAELETEETQIDGPMVRADQALYRSKDGGRNRVTAAVLASAQPLPA